MSNVEVNVWFRGDNEYIMRIDLLTAFGIKKNKAIEWHDTKDDDEINIYSILLKMKMIRIH